MIKHSRSCQEMMPKLDEHLLFYNYTPGDVGNKHEYIHLQDRLVFLLFVTGHTK